MNPEVFTAIIRETTPLYKDVFTSGGCYKFFKILEATYPSAEAYYDGNHVITKIDGNYYDVTGKVDKGNALRMTQAEQDEAEAWKPDLQKSLVKMLNADSLQSLSEITGKSVEELTTAITSKDEVSIELPRGTFFTDDELNSRDKSKYEEGKKVGIEKPIKEKARELGYEINGKAGLEGFLEIHNTKLKELYSKDASEQVIDLQTANENQKNAYESELKAKDDLLNALQGKLLGQRVNNSLLSVMPKETTIDKSDILTLFKGAHSIEELEGQLVVKRGDEVVRDPKSTKPISVDQVFSEWVVEKKFIANPGGRGLGNQGGGNQGGIKAESVEEFQNKWSAKNPGKSTASADYSKDYQEWRKSQKAA